MCAEMRLRPAREIVASLPEPPDDRERLLYVNPGNRLLSCAQLLSWTGLSVSLFRFSLNSIWLAPFAV